MRNWQVASLTLDIGGQRVTRAADIVESAPSEAEIDDVARREHDVLLGGRRKWACKEHRGLLISPIEPRVKHNNAALIHRILHLTSVGSRRAHMRPMDVTIVTERERLFGAADLVESPVLGLAVNDE